MCTPGSKGLFLSVDVLLVVFRSCILIIEQLIISLLFVFFHFSEISYTSFLFFKLIILDLHL